MKKISFIVSRYKELPDLSEMHGIMNQISHLGYEAKLIVYDKHRSNNDTYKLVPNIGRENFGWFDYVLSTWDHPEDFYVFAHPCSSIERPDKFEKFIHLCRNTIEAVRQEKDFSISGEAFTMRVNPEYRRKYPHLGGSAANLEDVKLQKFIETRFENLGEWWKARAGNSRLLPAAPVHGLCGGSAKSLHSWGKDFWETVMKDITDCGANGEIGHFLERAMVSIAAGRT